MLFSLWPVVATSSPLSRKILDGRHDWINGRAKVYVARTLPQLFVIANAVLILLRRFFLRPQINKGMRHARRLRQRTKKGGLQVVGGEYLEHAGARWQKGETGQLRPGAGSPRCRGSSKRGLGPQSSRLQSSEWQHHRGHCLVLAGAHAGAAQHSEAIGWIFDSEWQPEERRRRDTNEEDVRQNVAQDRPVRFEYGWAGP